LYDFCFILDLRHTTSHNYDDLAKVKWLTPPRACNVITRSLKHRALTDFSATLITDHENHFVLYSAVINDLDVLLEMELKLVKKCIEIVFHPALPNNTSSIADV